MRDWRRWPCVWRSPPCWALSASFFLVSPQCWPLPPSQLHMSSLQALCSGLPLRPLPENRGRQAGVPHAPVRTPGLSLAEKQVSSGPVLLRPWPLGILQVVHSEHPGFLPSPVGAAQPPTLDSRGSSWCGCNAWWTLSLGCSRRWVQDHCACLQMRTLRLKVSSRSVVALWPPPVGGGPGRV